MVSFGEKACHAVSLALTLVALCLSSPAAQAQFLEGEKTTSGPRLGESRTQKLRVGVSVKAVGGPCKGIYATMPVPADWPEQKV